MRRAFYIASTETSNAQFRQYEATHDSGLIESYSLDRDHQPVAGISWQQAASFCNWLSRLEGLPPFYRENQGIIIGFNPSSTGYRLPSEAEWAFAARADGDALRRFAWGNDFPPSAVVTNVADNTSALVTGRILNGEQAKEVGLVTRVADDPFAEAMALAEEIAGKNPDAVRAGKALYEQAWHADARTGLELEAALQAELIGTANQIEAVKANFEKRAPSFQPASRA